MPIVQVDAFAIHAYRAKIFFYTHSLKQLSGPYFWPKYLSYPLQAPLYMTWVAFNMGRWLEGWVQMTVVLNCLAFVVIIYNFMKFWTDKLTSLLTIVLMLSSLFFVIHASIVYCDFTVMFYTAVSLLLVGLGVHKRIPSLITLGGIMSASRHR